TDGIIRASARAVELGFYPKITPTNGRAGFLRLTSVTREERERRQTCAMVLARLLFSEITRLTICFRRDGSFTCSSSTSEYSWMNVPARASTVGADFSVDWML